MRTLLRIFAITLSLFTLEVAVCSAQTLTLNDASTVRTAPLRPGINIGAIDYYDNGQIYKNLLGAVNPNFEPQIQNQIWNLASNGATNPFVGTTTTFSVPDQYDGVPANYWAGATFTVVASQSGGTLGCTGTIASNTGPNYPTWVGTTNPVITVSSPCSGSFAVGDIVLINQTISPTPEGWWEGTTSNCAGGCGGVWANVSGGGKLTSDTTDLCATCGSQALTLDATSGSAGFYSYYDTNSNDVWVLMNGTYTLKYWAKIKSGSPTLSISAQRLSTGGFNCSFSSPTLTSSWAQYTATCTASETQGSTSPGNARVGFSVTGGAVYIDNLDWEKTSGLNPANNTILRDEVYSTLKALAPGTFRYWVNQNSETSFNWTQPDYARWVTSGGTGYFTQPAGAGGITLSLNDYLEICQAIGATPYLEVPITFSTTDAANLIEFLAGPSGSGYGARRAALGQTAPWTSVFSTIYLTFGNEAWNFSAFAGQALPSRSSAPSSEYYYDYSVRNAQIIAAMRGATDFTSSIKLGFDVQTAVTDPSTLIGTSLGRAKPDFAEINGYQYGGVSSFATDQALWQPLFVETYLQNFGTTDPLTYYAAIHSITSSIGNVCGTSGTAQCQVQVYEWGNGTLVGGIDQTHEDYINVGAGEAVNFPLTAAGTTHTYGIAAQNLFSLTEYSQGGGSPVPKLWGQVVDMGGATNNVRPGFLGMQLLDAAMIGDEFATSWTSNPTFNFTANGNGQNGGPQVPSTSNVPYLYAFAYKNGTNRSLVLFNTDLTTSHTVTFAGTNTPSGTTNISRIVPPSIDSMNEAATGTPTNTTPASVTISSSSATSPASITLSPFSMATLSWSTGSTPTAATPTFSPVAGTYSSKQRVTISTTTPGATIHYTVDGSTPGPTSPIYSHALWVAKSQTLKAYATASGYLDSAVGSAAYTITGQKMTVYISANASTDIPSPYPTVNRSVAAEWKDVLTTPATDCNTYNWTPLDNWITASSSHSAVNLYTFSHVPQCANGTTNFGDPPTDVNTTDTFFKNFVTAFMAHICSTYSGTPLPYTSCSNMQYIELWNEANVGKYWTGTAAQMAVMWSDAIPIIRTYCSDCIIIGGSTSAGGKGNDYYDTFLLSILSPMTVYPDAVSFHPYPSRTNVEPVPFPPSLVSNSSTTCTSGNTPNVSCYVAVKDEVTRIQGTALLTNSAISQWAANLPIELTEGGYGINDGVCDGADCDETHTNPANLRGWYAAEWMMALAPQNPDFSLWYVDKDQCWGTVTWNGGAPGSGCPNTPAATITPPSFTQTAINQMNTWLAGHAITGSLTSTAVTGGNKWSLQLDSGSAELDFCDAWLTSCTASTGFTAKTDLSGVITTVSGTVTLNQGPVLLTTTAQVATPTFSPAAGTYFSTQSITISTATSGATICYTNDGSTPTANGAGTCTHGTTYSTAVSVATTQTLKAIGSKSGDIDSSVGSAAYTINTLATPVIIGGTGVKISGGLQIQ